LPYMTFMQTQFEIIQSRETLKQVISKGKDSAGNPLDLKKAWTVDNDEDAYRILKKKVETQDVRGTDLIDIEVYDTDPKLASDIANAVAEAYNIRRQEEEKNRATKALTLLDSQIKKQEGRLEAARNNMIELMEELNIVDLSLGEPVWLRGSQPNTGTASLVLAAKQREFAAEEAIQNLRSTIKSLTKLEGEELIKSAVDLGVKNETLTTGWTAYQSLELNRAALVDSGVGLKHPKILNIDSQLNLRMKQLLGAVETHKKALNTQLTMAEQQFENSRESKERTEKMSLQERKQNVQYIEAKKEYELSKEMLNGMQSQLAKETIDKEGQRTPLVIHEKAEPSDVDKPARPNIKLHLVLGAAVGLIFGIGMAFFLEYLDTSVKSLDEVEYYLDLPVLAVIPKDVGVIHKQSGLSPDAEAYRILRTNIEFNRKNADANSITLVSGGAGEGKSTTLVNLAYVCAQGGYNTLMIDGDLRRPQLHTFFNINNSVGLTNYLTTDLQLEDVILQTAYENLYFMPSGILPADAAGILNSKRMSELIADVKSRFDLVFIDSPPILGVSDASVLSSEVDLTIIVIQHRKLPRGMLVRVKQAIQNVGGTALGVVLNNVDVRSDNQYQYYTSYYTYYAPRNLDPNMNSNSDDLLKSGGKLASNDKDKLTAEDKF
jgi:capsular exopolysaccharide synthesis family protein